MKEILFINFGSELCSGALEMTYEKLNLNHCYIIDLDSNIYKKNINIKKYFNHTKLTLAEYPDEIHDFPALEPTLLEEMSSVETVVLKMIDRLFKKHILIIKERRCI